MVLKIKGSSGLIVKKETSYDQTDKLLHRALFAVFKSREKSCQSSADCTHVDQILLQRRCSGRNLCKRTLQEVLMHVVMQGTTRSLQNMIMPIVDNLGQEQSQKFEQTKNCKKQERGFQRQGFVWQSGRWFYLALQSDLLSLLLLIHCFT